MSKTLITPSRLLILLLVLTATAQLARIVRDSGMLMALEPVSPDNCERIEGIVGGEDITIDRSMGFAFVSSDDRWAAMSGQPVPGRIVGLDLTSAQPQPISLHGPLPFSFHPHGISLYEGENGSRRLLVINHREDGSESVEIFDIQSDNKLVHAESLVLPDLISPNDLVATGSREFYITQDHGYPRDHWMQTLENYLGLPLASVAYYDGGELKVVASGLRYANGITLSPDQSLVYVAEPIARQLRVFEPGKEENALREVAIWPVGTGLDNLEWSESGELWTGAHPHLLAFAAHAGDASELSPSQVLRINPDTGESRTVFMDEGTQISGSSVAAEWKGNLLIGPVFQSHILHCQI